MYGWAIRNSHTSTDEDHKATQSWRQANQRTFPATIVRTLPYVSGFLMMISGYSDQNQPARHHPRCDKFLSHRTPA
jgi:hypothetical protein